MTRHGKRIATYALLAALLLAAPALAHDSDKPKTPEEKLLAALESIQQELKEIKTTTLDVQKLKSDVSEPKGTIAKLQQEIEALRSKVDPSGRTSFASPVGSTGRILLRNTSSWPVSIVVNDRSYRLEPGQTWTLESQPAGLFTYEVLGGPTGVIQPRVTRTLTANDTFPITVFNRY